MTATKPTVANVLATRYASPEMVMIWSAENKVVLERELWLAVLEAQKDLGIEIMSVHLSHHRSNYNLSLRFLLCIMKKKYTFTIF